MKFQRNSTSMAYDVTRSPLSNGKDYAALMRLNKVEMRLQLQMSGLPWRPEGIWLGYL